MPNGVAVWHVFARQVNPLKVWLSSCHVARWLLWISLKRSPDQHKRRKPPRITISCTEVIACKILRSHLIKMKSGKGRLSLRSLGSFCLSKDAINGPKTHANCGIPSCLWAHLNALIVTENFGPEPSDRRANEPLIKRSASWVSVKVAMSTCNVEQKSMNCKMHDMYRTNVVAAYWLRKRSACSTGNALSCNCWITWEIK